ASGRDGDRVVEGTGPVADAGLRQHQVDTVRSLEVTVEGGDYRPHLLEAGHREEGRRAAVGLHPDQVEVLLGLGELPEAMRLDVAARVVVRVDLLGEEVRRGQRRGP